MDHGDFFGFGEVVDDPLNRPQGGTQIVAEPVRIEQLNGSTAVPAAVAGVEHTRGALLTVVQTIHGRSRLLGTAVMIGPGLAITAAHVLAIDHEVRHGGVGIGLQGSRPGGQVDLWDVRHISYRPGHDVAALSLVLRTDPAPGWSFTSIPMTTRKPQVGESLDLLGFRAAHNGQAAADNVYELALLGATGSVTATYFPQRDSVMMPHPVIEIGCGATGGMSGGAVLDGSGHLVGIISASFDEPTGPTSASWVLGFLSLTVTLDWLPGLYGPATRQRIIDLDSRLVHIEGRDQLIAEGPDRLRYLG